MYITFKRKHKYMIIHDKLYLNMYTGGAFNPEYKSYLSHGLTDDNKTEKTKEITNNNSNKSNTIITNES